MGKDGLAGLAGLGADVKGVLLYCSQIEASRTNNDEEQRQKLTTGY
ncbi:MAG: hypothetical protein IH984_17010 [Planctomycetes bacterium]|nr:hypothetical protein [Planctomycetota bacterium]